jgi:hypothetical protein
VATVTGGVRRGRRPGFLATELSDERIVMGDRLIGAAVAPLLEQR